MEKITIKNTIKDVLFSQYQTCWNMISGAIENASQTLWTELKNEWGYAFNVFHVIEGLDFYSRKTPDGMEWAKRAGIDWEKDSQEILGKKMRRITKDLTREYLKDLKVQVSTNLLETSEYDFLVQGEFKQFKSRLERHVYSFRHALFHLGELNKTLRDGGVKRVKWE